MQALDPFVLAGKSYGSRLIVGTGKYKSVDETERALLASGAEIVTVALRRVDLADRSSGSLMALLRRGSWVVMPNTAGCHTADEAVRTLRLARELGVADLVKLEVIGDPKTLYPDNEQTLEAAKTLVKEGFTVLPYCIDDPIVCRKLQDLGCAAVMPLAAPIGSGLGIRNPHNLGIILEQAGVPVIVDAGVGTASDAAVAMELGCHGVLMNTAIAHAKDPVLMAEAMREAPWWRAVRPSSPDACRGRDTRTPRARRLASSSRCSSGPRWPPPPSRRAPRSSAGTRRKPSSAKTRRRATRSGSSRGASGRPGTRPARGARSSTWSSATRRAAGSARRTSACRSSRPATPPKPPGQGSP